MVDDAKNLQEEIKTARDSFWGFSVTVRFGQKSLEWRPRIGGNPGAESPLDLSPWEFRLIHALTDEFRDWLRKQKKT